MGLTPVLLPPPDTIHTHRLNMVTGIPWVGVKWKQRRHFTDSVPGNLYTLHWNMTRGTCTWYKVDVARLVLRSLSC